MSDDGIITQPLVDARILLHKTLAAIVAQNAGDMNATDAVPIASALAMVSMAESLETMAEIQQERWDAECEKSKGWL